MESFAGNGSKLMMKSNGFTEKTLVSEIMIELAEWTFVPSVHNYV